MGLLSKKEPELKDLKISQPIHFEKNKKVFSEENTKTLIRLACI